MPKLTTIAFSAAALLAGALADVVLDEEYFGTVLAPCTVQSDNCPQARCMEPPTGCETNMTPELIFDDAGDCCPKKLCDFVHTADQTPCVAELVEIIVTPIKDEDDTTAVPATTQKLTTIDTAPDNESAGTKPPTEVALEEEGDATDKPPTEAAAEEESDGTKPPTDAAAEEESDGTKPPTYAVVPEGEGDATTKKATTIDTAPEEEGDGTKPPTDAAVPLGEGDVTTKKATTIDAAAEEESDGTKPPTDAAVPEGEGDATTKKATTIDAAPEEEGDGTEPPTDAAAAEEEIGEEGDANDKPPTDAAAPEEEGDATKPPAELSADDSSGEASTDKPVTEAVHEHNCRTKEVWSEQKIAWCCEHHKLGCRANSEADVLSDGVPHKPAQPVKEIEESAAVDAPTTKSADAEINTAVYMTIATGAVMLACIAGYVMHRKNGGGHSRLAAIKEALVINPEDLYRNDSADVVVLDRNGKNAFADQSVV